MITCAWLCSYGCHPATATGKGTTTPPTPPGPLQRPPPLPRRLCRRHRHRRLGRIRFRRGRHGLPRCPQRQSTHTPAYPADRPQTTEFAARMRTWVSHSMPLLTAKIYRRTTPQHQTPTTFDHDAAEQRLADAFDGGGFDAWAEAAARELEAEAEAERARKRTAS